ncbi:hypothetical protein TWF718_006737 [Orbilia javanica]|uniref:Uncharacterized protein n=1 Tax=Orbilia javanica TaxID=47235 RepID=A0AAN8MXG7_9PEZI
MAAYTSSHTANFDNSVGVSGHSGDMESMGVSSDISRGMESMGLEDQGHKTSGVETVSKFTDLASTALATMESNYRMENTQSNNTVSRSESTATTQGGNLQDNGGDEEEDFEFERMVFSFRKAEEFFGASDWEKAELHLSAVVAILNSYPKFEAVFRGAGKFDMMNTLLLCRTNQNKWKEALKTIDIIIQIAKASEMLPSDLQIVVGSMEHWRSRAYRELGDLESARAACKKAVRVRRSDPNRLGESVKLMVEILGDIGPGAQYDVEVEFYKSLMPEEPDVDLQLRFIKETPEEESGLKTWVEARVGNQYVENQTPIDSDIENSANDEFPPITLTGSTSTETSSLITVPPATEILGQGGESKTLNPPEYPENAKSDIIKGPDTGYLERIHAESILRGYGVIVTTDGLTGKHTVSAEYSESEWGSHDFQSGSKLYDIVRKMIIEPGHTSAAELLLQYGHEQVLSISMGITSYRLGGFDYGTPLHFAVLHNSLEIAALLLKYGANFRALTKKGYTALHIAAGEEKVELKTMEFVLNNGAPTSGPILQKNEPKNSPLHVLLPNKESAHGTSKLALLLKSGLDVNAVNSEGETPLIRSIYVSTVSTTVLLLEAGADVKAVTTTGDSALHVAVRYYADRGDIQNARSKIEGLLKYKADKNLKNKDGKRPIDFGAKSITLPKKVIEALKPDRWYRF